jgi:hypothetical protein
MLTESDVAKPYGSKGIIPQAKVKTIKMTMVIVCGRFHALS